jgi:hypothetical protein
VFPAGLLITLLLVPAAAAQEVIENVDGTVSIRASDIPLGRVLGAIAKVNPFEKLVIDPSVEDRSVTVAVEHVSIARALSRILISADVNYVLAGSGRLFVGGGRASVPDDGSRPGAANPIAKTPDLTVPEPDPVASQSNVNTTEPEEPNDRPDHFASESRQFELDRALTPSAPPMRGGGGPIELPFPGPNGGPVTVFQPPGTAILTLPFPVAPADTANTSTSGTPSAPVGSARPGTPVTAPQPKPQPRAVPAVVDPKLQQLMEVLAPPVAPAR